MNNRYLRSPRAWMSISIAASLVAGLGACAGAQAAPAKAVKWVVTCPVKPREAARPDAEAVARVADQAAAALLDAPLHAAAGLGDASSSPPPQAPSSPSHATNASIVTAAAAVPALPSLAPQFPPLSPHPLSPPAAAEAAAKAATAPAAPAAPTTAPVAAALAGSAHAVVLQPASLAALAVPAPTAVAAAPLVPAPSAAAPVPAAAPSPVPLAPFATEPQRWEVRTTDVTLAKTLSRWAQEAGYRLKWDAARQFIIGAPNSFVGGFEDAVAQALDTPGVRSSDYPLEACVYANTPPLLRVTRQGEQVRDCVAVTP